MQKNQFNEGVYANRSASYGTGADTVERLVPGDEVTPLNEQARQLTERLAFAHEILLELGVPFPDRDRGNPNATVPTIAVAEPVVSLIYSMGRNEEATTMLIERLAWLRSHIGRM